MTGSGVQQEINPRHVTAQHPLVSVRNQWVEEAFQPKQLTRAFTNPAPGAISREGQEHPVTAAVDLLVEVIPQVTVSQVMRRLGFKR